MNNLHISLSAKLANASRLLKQTKSIASHQRAQKVYIAGIHEDGALSEEILFGDDEPGAPVVIKRFQFSIKISKKLIVNIARRFEFYVKVFWYYRNKKISMVNVHSLDLLPFGVALKYLYGAKLVYDTHELETETRALAGFNTDRRKRVSKVIERLLVKKVDQIFVVSESIADWYMDAYKTERPVVVLNAPKSIDVPKKNHFREKFNIANDTFIILYQGLLSRARGIHLLIDAFKQRSDKNVVLVVMGYGDLEGDVKAAAEQYDTIFFHDAVPTNVVLDYTASADMGIACIENDCLSYYYCMPNKLFEYAMAGLPMVVSNMKEMAGFVRTHQIGVVYEEESAQSISAAIEKLMAMDWDALKINAKRAAQVSCWDVQEQKMLAAYKRLGYFLPA